MRPNAPFMRRLCVVVASRVHICLACLGSIDFACGSFILFSGLPRKWSKWRHENDIFFFSLCAYTEDCCVSGEWRHPINSVGISSVCGCLRRACGAENINDIAACTFCTYINPSRMHFLSECGLESTHHRIYSYSALSCTQLCCYGYVMFGDRKNKSQTLHEPLNINTDCPFGR